jgi:hypothetical protein
MIEIDENFESEEFDESILTITETSIKKIRNKNKYELVDN